MNGLVSFLLSFGEIVLREAGKEATPMLITIARELSGALIDAIDVEQDATLSDDERKELRHDAIGTTKEAWQVLLQEGLLLKGDITILAAKAVAAQVADELGIV